MSPAPLVPLVALGFGKFARADRIYALQPLEGDRRGPGRRTLVWVEGLAEPMVASRSELAIVRDMGAGASLLPGDLADEVLGLLRGTVEQVRAAGPLLRREIRAEAGLDLDDLQRRADAILRRADARATSEGQPEQLF